jgi:hypothetical protein
MARTDGKLVLLPSTQWTALRLPVPTRPCLGRSSVQCRPRALTYKTAPSLLHEADAFQPLWPIAAVPPSLGASRNSDHLTLSDLAESEINTTRSVFSATGV